MQFTASSPQADPSQALAARHAVLVRQNHSKDLFMAELAHELRNALQPLRCALALMEGAEDDQPLSRQAMPVARRQVDHMLHLVDELLDVGRLVNGQMRLDRGALPLRELVADVLQGFSLLCTDRRTAFLLPAEPLWVEADATRLGQVLWNLLHNALKFTSAGDRIDVIVRRAGAWAEIMVADDGCGIGADQLGAVFELFKQERRQSVGDQGGLGVGLALARSVVLLHGGTISAASPGPHLGATFTVRLPLAPCQQVPLAAAASSGRGVAQSGAGVCSSAA